MCPKYSAYAVEGEDRSHRSYDSEDVGKDVGPVPSVSGGLRITVFLSDSQAYAEQRAEGKDVPEGQEWSIQGEGREGGECTDQKVFDVVFVHGNWKLSQIAGKSRGKGKKIRDRQIPEIMQSHI